MTLIKVEGLGRKFSKSIKHGRRNGMYAMARDLIGIKSIGHSLLEGEFWALKDVNLSIDRGESVALLGLNGSGKSTLLKLISGLMLPDEGRIETRGKLDALIELGTGFHPMLSGKDNIYIRCALNGLSQAASHKIYDEIVEFAELGDFIDMPLKNYSSGMRARLGFSAAIIGNPDILLVDEVLSVGDFKFKQKCLERINQIKKFSTVIFVSHSLHTVKMFCDRGIVLEKGKVLHDADIDSACKFYSERYLETYSESGEVKRELDASVYGEEFLNEKKISNIEIKWTNHEGKACKHMKTDQAIHLDFSFKLAEKPQNLLMGIPLWNEKNQMVAAFASDYNNFQFEVDESGNVRGRLSFESNFNPGSYQAVITINDGPEYLYRKAALPITLTGPEVRRFGVCLPKHSWSNDCNK